MQRGSRTLNTFSRRITNSPVMESELVLCCSCLFKFDTHFTQTTKFDKGYHM